MALFTIIATIIGAVAGIASYKAAKDAQKDAKKSANQGVLITKADTNAGLNIIYGERAVGATKTYKNISGSSVSPGSHTTIGLNKDSGDAAQNADYKIWLDRIDVIGQGPIEAVTNVKIDGDFYTHQRFNRDGLNHYRGIAFLGADNQAHFTEFGAVYSDWDSGHRGRGVAFMNNRFRHANDVTAFPPDPDVVMFVKGLKVWDPRKDVNYGGVGSHDLADQSTWEWSDNPALCLLDYLKADYGMALDISAIDVDTFSSYADTCEEQVTVPDVLKNTTGGTITNWYNRFEGQFESININAYYPTYRPYQTQGDTTIDRFACNVVLDPSKNVLDNVKTLLESFRGHLFWDEGKYKLTMETTGSSVMSIDEDMIIGGITFGQPSRSERMNRCTVKFANRNLDFKDDQITWPELGSAQHNAYLTEDNSEDLHQVITLESVTDRYQAEDIAEFLVRDSRASLSCEIQCFSKALQLQPGDIISLTHSTPGWTNKLFRVRKRHIREDLSVTLGLQEYQASVYPWGTKTNEPLSPDVNLPSPFDEPPAVTNVQASASQVVDGSGIGRPQLVISWDALANDFEARQFVVRYEVQSSGYYFETASDTNSITVLVPKDDDSYDIDVYYIDSMGQKSATASLNGVAVPDYGSPSAYNRVFYQSTEPTAGESNDGDLWYDTDDGNRLYIYETNTWVSRADDNKNRIFVQPTTPTATTTEDLWVHTGNDNELYSWNGTSWVSVRDGTIATAQATANTAQATANSAYNLADSKIESFYQDSAPVSADTGDFWIDTNDGNKLYRYNGTSWVLAQDDGIGQALTAASDAQSAADGKVVTFVQGTTPTAEGVGDLWVNTANNNRLYRWDGTTWVDVHDTYIDAAQATANSALTAAAAAQSTADGKIQSFYQTTAPGSADEGDIWFDTDDGNKIYIYESGSWVARQDSQIATALNDASTAQATADGKVTTYVGTSFPTTGTNPELSEGDLFFKTDSNRLYRVNADLVNWVEVGNNYDNTNQLTDGANLGDTANWSGVVDDDTNKPDNNATNNGTGGTNVGSNLVTTSSVQAAAITAAAGIDGATLNSLSNSWTSLTSVTLDLEAGATVALWWMCLAKAQAAGTQGIWVKLFEGPSYGTGSQKYISDTYYTVPVTARNVMSLGTFTATGGSSRVLTLQVRTNAATPLVDINDSALIAIQLKR